MGQVKSILIKAEELGIDVEDADTLAEILIEMEEQDDAESKSN